MVDHQQTRAHRRVVVQTERTRGTFGPGPARLLSAGLLLIGLTTMVVSATAQPAIEAPTPENAPLPLRVAELPPLPEMGHESPLALQNGLQPPEKLPQAPEKLPNEPKSDVPMPKGQFPEGSRMSSLPEVSGVLGQTPRPTAEQLKISNQFIQQVIDPAYTFDIIVNRTRIILLKETPSKIQVADESLISHNLLEPKQMLVNGRRVGSTVMTLWFPDPKDRTKEIILSYLVRVLPDPEAARRFLAILKALQADINKKFPDSMIYIDVVGDKVMVSGQAKDVQQATQILRIVRGNLPPDTQRLPVTNLNVNVNPGDLLNPTGTPGLDSFLTAGGPNIINNIRIPGQQQVMLRVVVAEVNRTAARSIGMNFNIINKKGTNVFGQQTGDLTVPSNVLTQQQNNTSGVLANLPIILDNGQIPIAIVALKTLNYARSLAEPNLTALNGQTASFQAGGSFPVPVVGGLGGSATVGLQGVQFIPYGVLLNFTPVILDRDRIKLQIQANVSTRDTSTGASIGTTSVPGLTTRNFTTTVEMREGQTMAVAGLMQTNIASETNRVPFFGDIPFLCRFMGYDTLQSGEQELVILVTPELVAPMEKKEVPKLPGSDLFEPSDFDFYFWGRLENRRSMDYRSQAMNDIHRMIRYHHAEQQYIFGPVGHTDDPNYPYDPYDRYGREIRPAPGGSPEPGYTATRDNYPPPVPPRRVGGAPPPGLTPGPVGYPQPGSPESQLPPPSPVPLMPPQR
jgi:pilus assembly protein CpaC